jgi:hypothetical protein
LLFVFFTLLFIRLISGGPSFFGVLIQYRLRRE